MRWVALVVAAVVMVGGCAERRDGAGAVTLVFKHAKILGPADPIPGLLREFEAAIPASRAERAAHLDERRAAPVLRDQPRGRRARPST